MSRLIEQEIRALVTDLKGWEPMDLFIRFSPELQGMLRDCVAKQLLLTRAEGDQYIEENRNTGGSQYAIDMAVSKVEQCEDDLSHLEGRTVRRMRAEISELTHAP
jgi:hypothetical protein